MLRFTQPLVRSSTRALSAASRSHTALVAPVSCSFSASTSQYAAAACAASARAASSSSSSPRGANADGSIDFGFQQVAVSDKQKMVHGVFARVAQSYDVMNDAMSMGMHRVWKADLVRQIAPAPNCKHLDVAGGTGDIAFRVLMAAHKEALPPAYRTPQQPADPSDEKAQQAAYDAAAQVIVCDINDNMLRVGIDRAREQYGYNPGALIKPAVDSAVDDANSSSDPSAAPVSPALPVEQLSASRIFARHGPLAFVSGNAECLPFESDSFDSYTIVFGLRNVTHRDRALKEALRVLRPGGRFLCMEFSAVTVPVFDQIYSQYSQWVIPALGQAIAGDRASYQYLVESIAKMPSQERLAAMVRDAGFIGVDYRNLTGGIVAIHQGFKPTL